MAGAAEVTARDIPGPDGPEMLTNLRLMRTRPPEFLAQCARRYGPVVRFPIPRSDVFFISDPVDIRRVLQGNHTAYGKRTIQYDTLALVTGSGLLTSDADLWRRMRRIVSPAFHRDLVSGMAETIVGVTNRWLAARTPAPGRERAFDMDAEMLELSLEILAATLLGSSMARSSDIVHAVMEALRVVVARAQQPIPIADSWPTPGQRRLERSLALIDAAVDDLIGLREKEQGGADALSLLVAAMREGVASKREVRDELVTLIVAGHETIAATLTWTWASLAAHPEVEARVHDEVDQLPEPSTWGSAVLHELPYTRAVVDECLRLYPPAWVVTRRSLETDVLGGKEIPANSTVILSPYVTHRDERWWPNALRFDPSRFVPGRAQEAGGSLTYFPFGAGPRLCIGRDLALLEAQLVVAALARRWLVRPQRPASIESDFGVTLRPRAGLPVSVWGRQ